MAEFAPASEVQPRWRATCTGCKFLGYSDHADIYIHPDKNSVTLVARLHNGGEAFYSYEEYKRYRENPAEASGLNKQLFEAIQYFLPNL